MLSPPDSPPPLSPAVDPPASDRRLQKPRGNGGARLAAQKAPSAPREGLHAADGCGVVDGRGRGRGRVRRYAPAACRGGGDFPSVGGEADREERVTRVKRSESAPRGASRGARAECRAVGKPRGPVPGHPSRRGAGGEARLVGTPDQGRRPALSDGPPYRLVGRIGPSPGPILSVTAGTGAWKARERGGGGEEGSPHRQGEILGLGRVAVPPPGPPPPTPSAQAAQQAEPAAIEHRPLPDPGLSASACLCPPLPASASISFSASPPSHPFPLHLPSPSPSLFPSPSPSLPPSLSLSLRVLASVSISCSVSVSFCLSVCLSVCPSVRPSAHLSRFLPHPPSEPPPLVCGSTAGRVHRRRPAPESRLRSHP